MVNVPTNCSRLVFGGPLSDGDQWQMGLWLYDTGLDIGASESSRQTIKTALRAWWQSTGTGIGANAKLLWAKCNNIGTTGKYSRPFTNEWVLVDDGGPGLAPAGTAYGHPSLSLALTTHATVGRGQASRGRAYPPAITFQPNANGKIDPSTCLAAAGKFAQLLTGLTHETANGIVRPIIVSTGVKSNPLGKRRVITTVSCGDEVDIQQRRRTAEPENYQVAAVANSTPAPDEGLDEGIQYPQV